MSLYNNLWYNYWRWGDENMVQNNSETAELKKKIEALEEVVQSLKAELNWKDEQIALFKKTLFW